MSLKAGRRDSRRRGARLALTNHSALSQISLEFCDAKLVLLVEPCPHFRLLLSSTGGSRRKCSRINAKRGFAREKLDFDAKTKEPWVKTQGSFVGGEGEIRTLEPCYGLHDFQSCALDQLGDFSIFATRVLYHKKMIKSIPFLIFLNLFFRVCEKFRIPVCF